jgi:hypothetical protein
MKNLFSFLIIILTSTFFISCTKTQLSTSQSGNQDLAGKVNPDVPQCLTGQHWDLYLRKCVDDCVAGYHNDSITGACVIDQGGGGGGMSTSAMIDSAGAYHNEYQDYMLNLIVNSTISLTDTQNLKTFIYNNSFDFFESKGIADDGFSLSFAPTGAPDTISFNPNNYFPDGDDVMLQLQNLVNHYDPANDASFYTSLNNLKSQALFLPGNDKLTVGIPVSVAISSFHYWETNYSKWDSLLTIHQQQFQYAITKPLQKLSLGSVGAADVGGAIRGAIGGVEGGPIGMVAGGVLVSATCSLFDIGRQLIGQFTGWW